MTHMMSICEEKVWVSMAYSCRTNVFVELPHFMKNELIQLKTKQIKQRIFKSMGIYGFP